MAAVHELSIVEALIEQVEEQVRQCGQDGRVTGLELAIGRLAGVNVESIRFAFQMLAPGTLLERAEMRISQPEALCCCRSCGARTPIDDLVAECPACGGADFTIEGGQQLLLETIELEEQA